MAHVHILVIFNAIRTLYLEHGGTVTSGQTGDFLQCNGAIFCGVTHLHGKAAAQFGHKFVRTTQGTWQVGTDLHAIFTGLMLMI